MPFTSKSQMRACFAKNDPDWDCDKWAHKQTKKERKNLPEGPKKKHMKSFSEYVENKSPDFFGQTLAINNNSPENES